MAKHNNLRDLFTNIANVIRSKTGHTEQISAYNFPTEIAAIPTDFPNGMTWTRSNITSGSFYSVYNANGMWVAGSDINKGLYYSTDGITWTQSNITTGTFRSLYNANGIWVAGSSKGLYYSRGG